MTSLLLTWLVWRRIRQPLRHHPVFRQARHTPDDRHLLQWTGAISLLMLVAIVLFVVMPSPVTVALLLLLGGFPLLIVIFNGLVLGAYWAVVIGGRLARERQNQRYELLAISQEGAFGVSWMMATGVVHRDDRLLTVSRYVQWIAGAVAGLLALFSLGLVGAILVQSGDPTPYRARQITLLSSTLLPLITGIVLVWLDHIQSICVGVLLGMLIPAILPEPFAVRVVAGAVFVMLQFIVYAGFLLMIFALQFVLAHSLSDLLATAFFCIGAITLFYLWRESLIGILLKLIFWRYQVTREEFQQATS